MPPFELSWTLKILLMAEIENESEGGDSPTTLGSTLESLSGGYEPIDDFPVAAVQRELEALIALHHSDATADGFLTDADWEQRERQAQRAYEAKDPNAGPNGDRERADVWCVVQTRGEFPAAPGVYFVDGEAAAMKKAAWLIAEDLRAVEDGAARQIAEAIRCGDYTGAIAAYNQADDQMDGITLIKLRMSDPAPETIDVGAYLAEDDDQ